jgi:NMD protein affecting ribosome stability and mRNA decay
VLKLLVVGRNGKEIAADLAISPETVREHVQSILAKLQVHSRLEAAARSISSEAHPEGRLTQDPRCPRCSAMLEETLRVKELEVGVGDKPRKVRIAYCGRCGSAVGLFA